MKILQINSTVNTGSTGRITEQIGGCLISKGHKSYIAYGRKGPKNFSNIFKFGKILDFALHVLKSRLLDNHAFASKNVTKKLTLKIRKINPDIIHLHNIHGYYINVVELFKFLKNYNSPIVWTFHDCWSFTGHCTYFDAVNCTKWQSECSDCPNGHGYPKSWWVDNSRNNFIKKKKLFTGLDNMVLVTPSNWLSNHVKRSFLSTYPVRVIYNGIDLDLFKPQTENGIKNRLGIDGRKIILGVASTWDRRKGLDDFIKLYKLKNSEWAFVLVGLSAKQIKTLPDGIIGIKRTESTEQLAELYSNADVFVNPTWVDNFPTTNIEALACGTPVVTYNTGGCPEALDEQTGMIVNPGDVDALYSAITEVFRRGQGYYLKPCRKRAEKMFNSQDRYTDYLQLYSEMIENKDMAVA